MPASSVAPQAMVAPASAGTGSGDTESEVRTGAGFPKDPSPIAAVTPGTARRIAAAGARRSGLVGESGSGKSTTGKAVLGLIPFEGMVKIGGQEIAGLGHRQMQPVRRFAQMIFQDPYASLDPRMAVGAAIAEPLVIHGLANRGERKDRVAELLRRVGLPTDAATRYPHEFSGGQRQRICIARALALGPRLIVADESVAALDVSVRAKVLDLMLELQETMGLAYLFISHDMAVIERMSHHVAVMRAGASWRPARGAPCSNTPRSPTPEH